MPTRVRLTKPLRSRPPGSTVTLPDGPARSLIAAGRARPLGDTSAPAPATNPSPPPSTAPPAAAPYPQPYTEPPRAGPGATREAWLRHAATLGVHPSADASRSDIIDACDVRRGPRGD